MCGRLPTSSQPPGGQEWTDIEYSVQNMGTKKKGLGLEMGQKGSWFPVPTPLKGYFGSHSRLAEEEQEMMGFAIRLTL